SSRCSRTSRATSADMTPGGEGRRWRLLLGTAAFAAWAPPSLVGLPLAGLVLATRPRSTMEWGAATGVGVLSVGLLLLPASDFLTGFVRAYTVLVAAAFVAVALLGPPLAPFREFHFGDHWVWAVVVSLTLWVTPVVATLKLVALNLLVALGGLYLVRGVAIVVACSAAFGIAPVALVIGAVVAAVLIAPLLFLVPGLATLGVTDTWLEFRRRLKTPA